MSENRRGSARPSTTLTSILKNSGQDAVRDAKTAPGRRNQDIIDRLAGFLQTRSTFFANFSAAAMGLICQRLELRQVQANTPLFKSGDIATELYIVAAGRVKVMQCQDADGSSQASDDDSSGSDCCAFPHDEGAQIESAAPPRRLQRGSIINTARRFSSKRVFHSGNGDCAASAGGEDHSAEGHGGESGSPRGGGGDGGEPNSRAKKRGFVAATFVASVAAVMSAAEDDEAGTRRENRRAALRRCVSKATRFEEVNSESSGHDDSEDHNGDDVAVTRCQPRLQAPFSNFVKDLSSRIDVDGGGDEEQPPAFHEKFMASAVKVKAALKVYGLGAGLNFTAACGQHRLSKKLSRRHSTLKPGALRSKAKELKRPAPLEAAASDAAADADRSNRLTSMRKRDSATTDVIRIAAEAENHMHSTLMGPGHALGIQAALSKSLHEASAIAEEVCDVLVVDVEVLSQAVTLERRTRRHERQDTLAKAFSSFRGLDLDRLERLMEAFKPSRHRRGTFLCMEGEQREPQGDTDRLQVLVSGHARVVKQFTAAAKPEGVPESSVSNRDVGEIQAGHIINGASQLLGAPEPFTVVVESAEAIVVSVDHGDLTRIAGGAVMEGLRSCAEEISHWGAERLMLVQEGIKLTERMLDPANMTPPLNFSPARAILQEVKAWRNANANAASDSAAHGFTAEIVATDGGTTALVPGSASASARRCESIRSVRAYRPGELPPGTRRAPPGQSEWMSLVRPPTSGVSRRQKGGIDELPMVSATQSAATTVRSLPTESPARQSVTPGFEDMALFSEVVESKSGQSGHLGVSRLEPRLAAVVSQLRDFESGAASAMPRLDSIEMRGEKAHIVLAESVSPFQVSTPTHLFAEGVKAPPCRNLISAISDASTRSTIPSPLKRRMLSSAAGDIGSELGDETPHVRTNDSTPASFPQTPRRGQRRWLIGEGGRGPACALLATSSSCSVSAAEGAAIAVQRHAGGGHPRSTSETLELPSQEQLTSLGNALDMIETLHPGSRIVPLTGSDDGPGDGLGDAFVSTSIGNLSTRAGEDSLWDHFCSVMTGSGTLESVSGSQELTCIAGSSELLPPPRRCIRTSNQSVGSTAGIAGGSICRPRTFTKQRLDAESPFPRGGGGRGRGGREPLADLVVVPQERARFGRRSCHSRAPAAGAPQLRGTSSPLQVRSIQGFLSKPGTLEGSKERGEVG